MSCEHDCKKPPVFPATISNRPGLASISYRIGDYGRFRAHMLAALDQQNRLSGWTHRRPDDPGIALLDGTAIIAEVLTFYQSLYANEAFLPTAQWCESVSRLIQLTGYLLAPGMGGEATFALAVDGEEPVIVPHGFGFKAQLEGDDSPAEFEMVRGITAYPHLSKFDLYRPRYVPPIRPGTNRFFIISRDEMLPALEITEDNRLLVGTPIPSADDPKRINNAEIIIVDDTWEAFGQIYIQVKGGITKTNTSAPINAYKLGRTFRHFGHTAPAHWVDVSTGEAQTKTTEFKRSLDDVTDSNVVDPLLKETQFLLDSEIDDFAVGSIVLIQARLESSTQVKGKKNKTSQIKQKRFDRTFVRKVVAVMQGTYTWGPLSSGVTLIELDEPLLAQVQTPHGITQVSSVDIRTIMIHEVTAQPVQLCAAHKPMSTTSGNALHFFGTADQHRALDGRSLLLRGPDGGITPVTVTSIVSLPPSDDDRSLMRQVNLSQTVNYAHFDLDQPETTIYGNVVHTTQGKTQDEVALGNGDARQVFQTFAVPKKPLTYLLDQTQTPPQVPELKIYVDGILWKRVHNFFNAGPKDRVYVVREDEEGNSYVQFGDGKTGARLPSGRNNVVVRFRVGSGARGRLDADAKPRTTGKLKPLREVFMPGSVVGGADQETADNARTAAPMRMQSLGRLVGLADYEAEALMLPGVLKARADWVAPTGVPRVRLVVLTEGGNEEEANKVAASISTANRRRGAARFTVETVQGVRQYLHLDLTVGYAANRRAQDIKPAVLAALGVTGEEGNGIDGSLGLFGLPQRRFGQGTHVSQVVGAVQQVDGVSWVRVDYFQAIPLGSPPEADPTALAIPVPAFRHEAIGCAATAVLTLHNVHLDLSLTRDETGKGGGI